MEPRPGLAINEVDTDLAGLLELACQPGADWVLLTDGETVLEPTALAELLASTDAVDVVIGDEDTLDGEWQRVNPHFKPLLSPELLATTDYFGGAWLVQRECLANIKSQANDPRSWLWEIALCLVRAGARVARVPRVLSHRAVVQNMGRLGRLREDAVRIVESHCQSWGSPCTIEIPEWSIIADRLVCQPVFPMKGREWLLLSQPGTRDRSSRVVLIA